MKTMMIILDGLTDEPLYELNNKTVYEYAKHEHLDQLAAEGVKGYFQACPPGYLPESMSCILNLLGIPLQYFPKSRASLELLAHGRVLMPDEVVLRCNLVAVQDNNLASFNAEGLAFSEMRKLSEEAAQIEPRIDFIHLSGYRNLLVMKKEDFKSLDCITYPPHEWEGEPIPHLLQDIFQSSTVLERFVLKSQLHRKGSNGETIQYLFYPWGISEKDNLPAFKNLYGIQGAAVCGAEIAKGIAKALGLFVPEVKGLTADVDTDLRLKIQTASSLLNEFDFVFVHINGLDEAAHRYDCRGKLKFLERVDQEFFAPLLKNPLWNSALNILVCADHATSPVSGKHSLLPVPYMIKGPSLQHIKHSREIHANEMLRLLLSNI